MSILLDALKKSEEQRQLGTTPNIYSNVDEHGEDEGAMHRWIPVAMSALTAVVIAWIGWNQYQAPFNVLDATGQPPDTTLIAEQEKQQAEAKIQAEEALAEETQQAPEVRPPGFRSPVQDYRSGGAQQPVVTDLPPGSDAQRDEDRARINRSIANYQAGELGESQDPGAVAAGTGQQAGSGIDVGKRRADERRNRPMEPAEPEPISYWSLPQGVRENLPEFKISVLVYAEQPDDRFLLMNGKRWVEKESEGGVRLDEIRRDGAVFLYQKYRFLVKG